MKLSWLLAQESMDSSHVSTARSKKRGIVDLNFGTIFGAYSHTLLHCLYRCSHLYVKPEMFCISSATKLRALLWHRVSTDRCEVSACALMLQGCRGYVRKYCSFFSSIAVQHLSLIQGSCLASKRQLTSSSRQCRSVRRRTCFM